MTHPSDDALIADAPAPEVADHLRSCPRCRIIRRLHTATRDDEVEGLEEARVSLSAARQQSLASVSHELGADRDPLRPGERVGPWVVEGRLGAGALAIVYRVRHVERGEVAALKVIDAGSATLRGRAAREARAQIELRHPCVVPVLDVLEAAGRPALLLELIPGPTLAEVIDADVLPMDQRLGLALDLVEGVRAAHEAGLIHRDLKPANVLVDPRHGRLVARVTDFGMVKRADAQATRLTATGAVLGTPAYMAPEQILDSGRVDRRADIFAVGAMLFELVTGLRAFRGSTLIEVFDRIRSGARPSLDELAPDLPDALRRAIDGALRTDPEERLGSTEALAVLWREGAGARHRPDPETIEAVARLVEGRPVQTHSVTFSLGPSGTAGALVAREALLARVTHLVMAPGATALVGAPGVGTTALAVGAAEVAAPYLGGGVVWVALGHARDEDEVHDAVVAELGVRLARRADLAASLAAHGPLLLVLDRVDPDALGGLASAWMATAPQLRILATCHRAIPGFSAIEVPPLPLAAARVLWAERAGDALDERRVGQIVETCGGLPLLVELAAAGVGVSPDLCVAQAADPVVAWREVAAGLLTPDARRAWEVSATFRGGFTVDALAALLGDDVDELDVEDWLDELVGLGIVRSTGREGVPRFRLAEALAPAVEPDPRALDRLLAWCVRAEPQPEDRQNLRIAMAHATAEGDLQGARTCARRLLAALSDAGDDEEIEALATRMQVEPPEPGPRRRRLREALEQAADSRPCALEALHEARKLVRPTDEAWARALLARMDGRPDALRAAADALDPARRQVVLGWIEAYDTSR